ncbi:tetraacyldisaccharide 4'-kinase [Psychroserpens sp. MEBiC05023]
MKLLRKILFPIVPIYYFVTWLRNKCYDLGWKSSKSYELPVICVGNLSTGGTGKTPTIEYLAQLIKGQYKVAILSRGYKRQSSGFIIADANATAKTIGDEPFQYYQKFHDVIVSVDADRQHGISQLIKQKQPNVILLDDAFQHRKVKAGFNILLTAYGDLYSDDIVLPTGNLREPKSGAKRADIIVVTKCPSDLETIEKEQIIAKLNPLVHQSVFFSHITYSDDIYNEQGQVALDTLNEKKITLVTGIANPKPLLEYLDSKSIVYEHLKFNDHHAFSPLEIESLKSKKLILTTEKDYVRLQPDFKSRASQLYYLPISFTLEDEDEFDAILLSYVSSNL